MVVFGNEVRMPAFWQVYFFTVSVAALAVSTQTSR
jgi:hypothetical protein